MNVAMNRLHNRFFLAAVAAAVLIPVAVEAQARSTGDTFTWEGQVPSGEWVEVRNTNGDVRVERAAGNQVEVLATKRWTSGDPDRVRVELVRTGASGQGVLVCAIWDNGRDCDNRSSSSGWFGNSNRGNVSVEFVVRLPAGVKARMRTTNGTIRVLQAGAEVDASSTNGDVEVETAIGPVRARTTNGSITVLMAAVSNAGDMSFSTTNGSVTVHVPADYNANVSMRTTNGSLSTDFPLTVQGQMSRRAIDGTLGRGGPQLTLRTTNGDVRLKRVQ
jgi:archaellum component FlaG (FlaF/FlaG flagellin family)